jgi:hypothetical protein
MILFWSFITLNSIVFHLLSCDEMKLIDPNVNFMGFYFLNSVYLISFR